MADEQAKPCPNDKKEQLERRSSKSRLAKQDEVEELEEEDNSPSSEASDATIVPVLNTPGGSPQSGSPQEEEVVAVEEGEEDDDNTSQTHPRVKVLVRSQALRDDSSPPPDSTGETSSSSSTTSISSPVSALTTPQESKGRLEKQGSGGSSSLEIYGTSPHCLSPAGGNSPALSRDTSVEMQYTDSTGTDLEEFITMTLNKNLKDRNILLKMECDLNGFVKDQKHDYLKFPPMTSYHRMLVHRVAAFFGLDHNVDTSGKQVVVNKTPNTRIPDYKFLDHIRDDFDQPKKLILKRDTGSFDDGHGRSSEKMSLADKRSKSYEEREEEYQKSSSSEGMLSLESPMSRSSTRHSSKEDLQWREHPRAWSSTESSGYGTDTSTKFHKLSVPKASSFGETGMTVLARSDSKGSSRLSKNDSMNSVSSSLGSPMTRPPPIPSSPPLDSSSSSQSAPSPAQQQKTPSPSGHTGGPPINLEPGQQVLCLADVDTLPPGSIIIDPATGQPYRNPDGTVYRHNPTPAQQAQQQSQQQQQQPAGGTAQPPPPPPQLASPQGPYCYGANYQPKAPLPVLSPQQSLDSLNNPELTQRLSHMAVSPQGSLTISPQASVDQPEVTPGGQAQQQQMFMVPVQQQQQPTAVYQHPQHPQQSQPTQQQQQVYFPANQQVASGQQQAYATPQYASQTPSQLPTQGSLEGHPVVQQHPLHLTQQSSTETQLQYNSQNYPPVHMVQGYTAPQATHGEVYPTPQGFPTHQQPGQPQGYAIRPQAELPTAAYQQYPQVGQQHLSSSQTVVHAGGQQSQPVYYNVTSSTGNTQYVPYQQQPHEQPQAAGFRPQSPTSQQPGMQPPAQSQTYIMGTPQLAQPVTSSCGSQVVAYPSYPGVAQPQQHRAQSPPQQASSMVYSSMPGHPPPTQGAPRTASPPVNPVNIQYTQAVGGPQVHGYPNPTERPGNLNLREGVVPGAPVSIPHGHITPVAAHPQPTIRPQLPAVKLRPPTNTAGDVRFVGPSIQPRIPIQPMFQQFQRFPAHMGVISKAPRGRKAWTRLSKESSQSPSTSTESEPSGSVALEVTDVQPNMKRSELEAMLEDLINQGVQLRYQLEDVNKGTSNFSVSDCTCILAIFDSECNAQTALSNQSKGLGYTLRPSQRQLLPQEPLS